MKIQQQDKESLAAHIHQFKTEAKRCNFTNDPANIQIFIKGLNNAHSLATCIYEKGTQTLSDTISEVEKLNAAQTNHHNYSTNHSQHDVKQRGSLFSVPETRTYSTKLP